MAFLTDKIISEGLTFDDVLLVPAYSEVIPKDVSLNTLFSNSSSVLNDTIFIMGGGKSE